jgi:hypothetical protein
MKNLIYSIAVLGLAFTSCQSEETTDGANNTDNTSESTAVNTSKFEELAVEPCNLLTEDMVASRFSVNKEELDLSKYASSKGKVSWSAYCTYSWKKPNFDEIAKRTQEKMMDAMKSGNTQNAMSVAMDLERAKFEVGVTNLQIYDNAENAKNSFNQSHTVPEKKDVEKLNEAIDAETNEALTEQGKEIGKDMVGGIAANLKFDKIDGIGTLAYWDHLGGKLDVLYGTIQIGIIMHISEDHDENVAAAKALAQEIMKQF